MSPGADRGVRRGLRRCPSPTSTTRSPCSTTITRSFGTSEATAGLVVTMAQVGYALGLALLVPLGDMLARRRMVPVVLLVTTVGLVVSAALADHRRPGGGGAGRRGGVHGGPDAGADGGVAGRRRHRGPGRGPGDERAAARDPAGPHRLRARRRARQLARGLRDGRRGVGGAWPWSWHGCCPARWPRPSIRYGTLLRSRWPCSGTEPVLRRRDPLRRPRVRRLQRVLDDDGLRPVRVARTTTATPPSGCSAWSVRPVRCAPTSPAGGPTAGWTRSTTLVFAGLRGRVVPPPVGGRARPGHG